MSLQVIAERHARDPFRSRSVWVYVAVYVLVFSLAAYIPDAAQSTLGEMMVGLLTSFVPLTAFILGYQTVAQGRQDGGLRVVLSQPHTRRELVVGTAVGRALVMAGLVTFGFVVATLTFLATKGVPEVQPLLTVWILGVLLAVAVLNLAVSISASVRTTKRAAMFAFGSFLLISALWGSFISVFRYVLNGFSMPPGPQPEWALILTQLNPTNAFQTAVNILLSNGGVPVEAFYFTDWFSVLVLVAWIFIPLAAGALRFERSDL